MVGKPVTLPDGRTIAPEEVLGGNPQGNRRRWWGCGEVDSLVDVCRDVDGLVIESTYLDEEADMARHFGHLTARKAADLAVRAGARHFSSPHISRRYPEKDVLAEAQSVFPNVVVAGILTPTR